MEKIKIFLQPMKFDNNYIAVVYETGNTIIITKSKEKAKVFKKEYEKKI